MALVINTRELDAFIRRARAFNVRPPTAVLDAIGAAAETRARLGFRNSAAPSGEKWAPLKRRRRANARAGVRLSAAQRRRRGGQKPLQHTGALLRSINYRSTPTQRRVRLFAGVDYARYHQFGTSRIPARPFFPTSADLPPRWRRAITKAAEREIERALLS